MPIFLNLRWVDAFDESAFGGADPFIGDEEAGLKSDCPPVGGI